jgi:hypothetical protein
MPSVSNHPTLDCSPNLRAALLFSQSEDGEQLVVPIIGMTFRIEQNELVPAEEQFEIKLGGEYWGEPGASSLRFEPQVAFTKLATDVILVGHAYSFGRSLVDVSLRVGALRQMARVVGDRYWMKSLTMISMTSPEPYERIPLIYERAFGGWDRSDPDPDKHTFEPRNPIGTGFRSKEGKFQEGIRLPNLEDPRDPVREYGQSVLPVGFGFTSPDWRPRAALAGTYDKEWMDERMPLLPKDFDRRFFNAASPGLIAPGYLNGDEPVAIENASPRGMISFNLPGVSPPHCRVQLKGGRDAIVQTNLDTVVINTDEDLVLLMWRGYLAVRNGSHDIVSIQVRTQGVPASVAVR